MIRLLLVSCIAVSLTLSGCGGGGDARPELIPVTGTVTFQGKPVEGALVTFSNKNAPRSAQGKTDTEGKFILTSYDSGDGAIPGDHAVTITKTAAAADSTVMTQENAMEMMKKNTGMMQGGKLKEQAPAMILPAKYADAKTSGETRTVKKGDKNDFNFELKE